MSERVVCDMIPLDWNGHPYFVACELKSLLASVVDHGTKIDSGTMGGQARLWATIGDTEYFIVVEKASGQSKSNPLVPQEAGDE